VQQVSGPIDTREKKDDVVLSLKKSRKKETKMLLQACK
jgi:hypothetical protein